MKKKSLFNLLVILGLIFFLSGCKEEMFKNGESAYDIAVENGFKGTEVEWLEYLKGENGEDGKEIELQVKDGYIQYKYDSDEKWLKLISILELTGEKGNNGREIELQIVNGYIKWKYVDENGWIDLINLETFAGKNGVDGKNVEFQVFNGFVQWKYEGDSEWKELIELSTLVGPKGDTGIDGKTVELQVANGFIQWKYVGEDEWKELIELSTLVGPKGDTGIDGQNVELQVANGFIQWKHSSDENWTNLVDLSTLIGEKGKDGNEVEFQVSNGFVQWKYINSENWNNLIDLSTLKGEPGKDSENYNKMCKIDFVLNEGYFLDGSEEKIEVLYGNVIELPMPHREGYIFKGWYTGYGINDGQFTNAIPIIKDTTLYAIWEEDNYNSIDNKSFNKYIELEEYTLESKDFCNNTTIYKYKIGTLYNVPISYGVSKKMIGQSINLQFSYANVLSESITKGIEIAKTKGREITVQSELNINLKYVEKSISYGNTDIESCTVSKMESYSSSLSKEMGSSIVEEIVNNADNAGYSFRINLAVDFDYFVYVVYDLTNNSIIYYLTSELNENNGLEFIVEKSINKNGDFLLEEAEINTDHSYITMDRLTADGLFKESNFKYTYEGLKAVTEKETIFTQLWPLEHKDYLIKVSFTELFGINRSELINLGLYDSINLEIKFTYKCNQKNPCELLVAIPVDKDSEDIIVSKEIICPQNKYFEEVTELVTFENVKIESLYNEFYIGFTAMPLGFNISNYEISDVVISANMSVSEELLEKNGVYNRNEILTIRGIGITDTPKYNVNDKIDLSEILGMPLDVYKSLGYSTIELDFSFTCSRSKYGTFSWFISDEKNNETLGTPTYKYVDNNFNTGMNSSTTSCSGNLTIDINKINNNDIYFIWQCIAIGDNTGSASCTDFVLNITVNK